MFRRIALATALALALAGCAEHPKGNVLDYPPGAFGADGKPVSRCLRVFGSDCLAPAPKLSGYTPEPS